MRRLRQAGSVGRDHPRGRLSRRATPVVFGALAASGALVLAACGASGGGAGSSTSASSSASASASSSGGSSSQAQALMKKLTALEGLPSFTAPGPALNAKKLPSSTGIVVIDNTPGVGPLQQAAAGAMDAAKAAGFSPKLLNGGANNTPSQDIHLLEEAVNLHPKVVLQVGIITALETAGLKYAKSHGVPVVAVDDDQPKAGAPGEGSGPLAAATAQENDSGMGKIMADYVAAHGPADATIGTIVSKDIVPSNIIYNNFTSELSKVCPHCTVISQNVDTAEWTSQITPTVTSMLRAHPTMNYLFPIVDGMAPWITPALSASNNKNLSVISVNATPGAAMKDVQSGVFAAEVGTNAQEIGWYAFDGALRVMLKLPMQTNPQEPMTFFTTQEMKSKNLGPSNVTQLFGDAYKTGFLKLWGVK